MTTVLVSPGGQDFRHGVYGATKNEIVDAIAAFVNETLRVADLNHVPRIAEKVSEIATEAEKNVKAAMTKATAAIPTLVRSAIEDYQLSRDTRDEDRLEASKKKLRSWLKDNMRNEIAQLVSTAVKPYA